MRLLIIGASGLIGGQCLRHFNQSLGNENVLGTYYSYPAPGTVFLDTLDIANPRNPGLRDFQPTHILHAGALTHVDRCETEPEESHRQTVVSTQNVITLARTYGAHFTYISTDYAFDGKRGPYVESDQTNPLSVYAKHKLQAEKLVELNPGGSLILRVTNVYGDELRRKNFVARLIGLGKSGEEQTLRLPMDQYATPINAADVARALGALLPSGNGLYHLSSTDYVNRVQLAERVLSCFPNHRVTILPVKTKDLNQAAARPLLGGLIAEKFLRLHPRFGFTNLDDYLRVRPASA